MLCVIAQAWLSYVDSSLAFIGISAAEITFRTDYSTRDPYRFALVDELLRHPLTSKAAVENLAGSYWEAGDRGVESLIGLCGYNTRIKPKGFEKTLVECNKDLSKVYANMPDSLLDVFEQLTRFAPGLTKSVEEEKAGERRYDSLCAYLKIHGTAIDYDLLFDVFARLNYAVRDYPKWLSGIRLERFDHDDIGSILFYEQMEFGLVVIGDTGSNFYNDSFALIIDLGGDDTYDCRPRSKSFQIIIDRSGDDRYLGGDRAVAAGVAGISIIIDESGNDHYQAGCYSLGCGVFGCGLLIDKEGNDRYIGDTFTQGAGGFGIGILHDDQGNDVYEAALYAQGFASTYGIGVLTERDGNDMYLIQPKYIDEIRYLDHYLSLSQGFTIGFRPDLSAGIGLIFERGGNDYYLSDIFGQGSAYWYGLGAIIDEKGNDNYVSYQYAQGSGVHIAIGLLVDLQGDDNYVAKGVSQGCGHDLAFGLLHDVQGDDSYVVSDLSQGAGNANGIGFLIDEEGDDSYSVKRTRNTQGYGDFRREYGSIGLLIDIKGDNAFTPGSGCGNLWKKGEHGLGIDWGDRDNQ